MRITGFGGVDGNTDGVVPHARLAVQDAPPRHLLCHLRTAPSDIVNVPL